MDGLLLLTSLMGVSTLVVTYLFWRKGHFDDVEDVKYELFRNDKDD